MIIYKIRDKISQKFWTKAFKTYSHEKGLSREAGLIFTQKTFANKRLKELQDLNYSKFSKFKYDWELVEFQLKEIQQ